MKPKHIPLRTCVGCHSKKPQEELSRIGNGRGIYLCKDSKPCFEQAMKKKRLSNDNIKIIKQKFNSS